VGCVMVENDKPKERFSERAAYYVRYRPSYPTAVITHLQTHCNLTTDSIIADIGSGTGLLAQLFLERGNTVYGVEPNQAMREAGESYLADYATFHSINASAETTTLADNSVDFVVAGQAAHWFVPLPTKAEFERILRPNGHLVFVWNKRDIDASPFMHRYEKTIHQFARSDSYAGSHAKATGMPDLILGDTVVKQEFDYADRLDYATFEGRALSSSIAALAGDPLHEPFLAALRQLFEKYAENGRILFQFKTKLYVAKRP